ncbi:DUF4221 family protein [Olivibacter sitiensis]|uniref:DUF4221 family protein n=1 Tax=Olivibacter sitiensis TaxID=376470 RepID=UPI000420E0D9|nr:DUF4221 family protein [Olivibacter sitiensis]
MKVNEHFFFLFFPFFLIFGSCSNDSSFSNVKVVKNPFVGKLRPTHILEESADVIFQLDSLTAPKIEYAQFLELPDGKRVLSFLNHYTSAIYQYDYDTRQIINSINIGSNLLPDSTEKVQPKAYHLSGLDSVYIYNQGNMEYLLYNKRNNDLTRISLIADQDLRTEPWYLQYPQYYPQGTNQIVKIGDRIFFSGQTFQVLKNDLLKNFRFVSSTNVSNDNVDFLYNYPDSLYGSNYNWGGDKFFETYMAYNADRNILVFSFPVSHNLYITAPGQDAYSASEFAGSNYIEDIRSMATEVDKLTEESLVEHTLRSDEYASVRYDPYRKVYYRFVRHGIKDYSKSSKWNDKSVSVIILDENFKYIGEKNLGLLKNWFIQNVFVSDEGLHIEYIPDNLDEERLIYKTFKITIKA